MIKPTKSLKVNKVSQVALLLICWIGIPWIIVEMAMILLDPFLFRGFYQYDPDMGFRVRPDTLGSNRFGFNDQDYPLERVPGTVRMMIVGDSFNWAGGLEGNYTTLLENQFAQTPDLPPVEVINAGYPMTHAGEQLIMLQKFGLQYQPDLVVLGVFVGNDFIDADPYRKRIVVNDTQIDIDKRNEIQILGYPIIFKSRLWMFIEQKYKVFQETAQIEQPAWANPTPQEEQGTFTEETFLKIQRARLEFCNLRAHTEGKYDDRIKYLFDSITQMKQLLAERQIEFKVAIYPDEFQVSQALADQLFEMYQLNREDYDLNLMQKLLIEFLDREGISYIDMLDQFRQVGQTQTLYLLRDTHWNLAGNQLASEILYQNLLDDVKTK
ncbi:MULTISPECIES: alginate O-acetyltransferase AlgX-related protein [unclassified Roseofilum]|uniref:alginate O-acetyltransferase AlgX-related protein n=1 Tax=unclassified Roseofilum TaxID=2620099 RepID=UPI001B137DD2|nr:MULTISPECIES: hypothetical protein [unclassified Roseofilum]MBP0010367.1 hypothetical protein [Roseofilum sp. Belize Diploria]MBP0034697.1 hypothetical protein [Roseofilum sp. Belize BBD 4]